MATYLVCTEDPHWHADSPVSTWTHSMIETLANTLIKVAREGTDEQRDLLRMIGEELVDMTTTPAPKARRADADGLEPARCESVSLAHSRKVSDEARLPESLICQAGGQQAIPTRRPKKSGPAPHSHGRCPRRMDARIALPELSTHGGHATPARRGGPR